MVARAKIGNESLANHHLNLTHSITSRLKKTYCWVEKEELGSYAYWGLRLAAEAYNPDCGVPFIQFAWKKAFYLAIDQMRKDGLLRRSSQKEQPRFISIFITSADNEISTMELDDSRAENERQAVELRDLCRTILALLPERDRQFLTMYYSQDLSYKEMAAVFEISESAICLRHKVLLEKLRRVANISRISG